MNKTDLEALRDRIDRLSPADQLRLAACLIEADRADIGIIIAENVVMVWQAAQLLQGTTTP